MGLRGPRKKGQESWMVPVAELMVQEHMSFSAACQALGVEFDNSQQERAAQYSEAFQNIVTALGYKFYARIGDDPLLTRGVILGWLKTAVERLGQQEQWDRVAVPAKLMSDIMGLTREGTLNTVSVALTQKEIDDLRAKAKRLLGINEDSQKAVETTKTEQVDIQADPEDTSESKPN